MNKQLGILSSFRCVMNISFLIEKTSVMSTGQHGHTWKVGDNDEYLEESLMENYLGINIKLRG